MIMGKMKRLFCVYFDVPTIVVLVLIISVFYRPLANALFRWIGQFSEISPIPSWVTTIGLNVIGGLICVVLVAIVGFVLLNWNYKSEVAGTYNAYVITENNERESWGEVKIKYNLITDKFRTYLKHEDRQVNGHAKLVAQRYLVGYYTEEGKPTRRRFGSFLYTLTGEGNAFEGSFLYFDPTNETYDRPDVGRAIWEKT